MIGGLRLSPVQRAILDQLDFDARIGFPTSLAKLGRRTRRNVATLRRELPLLLSSGLISQTPRGGFELTTKGRWYLIRLALMSEKESA